jgi:hypothetical protein
MYVCIGCVYSRVVALAAAASRLVHTVAALTMLAAFHCTPFCLAQPLQYC